jgi:hypothetical protein
MLIFSPMQDGESHGVDIDELNRRIGNRSRITSTKKRSRGQKKNPSLTQIAFGVVAISFLLDVYSIIELSNLSLGRSMLISKIANSGYVISIILAIISQKERNN